MGEQPFLKTRCFSLSWFSSVDRVPACGLKGPGLHSGQGHLLGLQAQSPVGGMQDAGDQ